MSRKRKKEKKKRRNVEYRAFIDLPDDLYLAVKAREGYRFAHWNPETEEIEFVDRLVLDGKTILPLSPEVKTASKPLPVGYPTGGIADAERLETRELFRRIRKHLLRYMDLSGDDLDLVTFFILSTWFYRKLDTVAYLRFIGDTGKGKSRMLTAVGDLCFYPLMVGGGTSRPGIMRVQERFHGTLVLDEADFSGDKDNEMIKYINAGFERRKVTILTNKANPSKLEVFDPFSPKIFAMRETFSDAATEGRVLSIEPYETRRSDIPPVLPPVYHQEVLNLRNIIAAWTLRNWKSVRGEVLDLIQGLPVEPRLKQLAAPLSIILPLFGDSLNNRFVDWILDRQKKIAEQRANSPEGSTFNALVDLATGIVNPAEISSRFEKYVEHPEDSESEPRVAGVLASMIQELTGLSSRRISKILTELGFFPERRAREINGVRVRGRFICLDSTRRWVEDWRRYRSWQPIIEVPEIYRSETRKYEPVVEHLPKPTPVEMKILEEELTGGMQTVRCTASRAFTLYSRKLGRDVLIPEGIELHLPQEIAWELEIAGRVRLQEGEG